MHSLVLIAGFETALWRSGMSPEVQTFIFYGSLSFVAVLIFLWAILWRQPARPQHTHGKRRVSHHVATTPLPERRKRRSALFRTLGFKRRHRRRHQRLTNPTLADAGGLPPQRNEDPSAS